MKAVIIAAGMGSRLWAQTNKVPKTLLPYNNGTILSNIIGNFNVVGIYEFVIVVGYQAHFIEKYIAESDNKQNQIDFVTNNEWQRGNGISVLTAEPALGGQSFILSMSDHIVSPTALRRIANADDSLNSLLVDPDIKAIFDIDDATKIQSDGSRIIAIGKNLESYNGIDCGIFKLTDRYFTVMRQALAHNEESISAAIKLLINNNDMKAVFTQPGDQWIDIDTPEAYQHCLNNIVK